MISVEILQGDQPNTNCKIPNLPQPIYGTPSMFQHGSEVILCGGSANDKNCFKLKESTWSPYNELKNSRVDATTISTNKATYIIGGRYSRATSEILNTDSDTWMSGPTLPNNHFIGCGVQISDTELIVTGGYGTETQILRLNMKNSTWTESEISMVQGRRGHGCLFYQSKVILAGGYDTNGNTLKTTEIVQISENGKLSLRKAGNLNVARVNHGMGVIKIRNTPKAIAYGGLNEFDDALNSVDIWDDASEIWLASNLTLNISRWSFGYDTLPIELLCPT